METKNNSKEPFNPLADNSAVGHNYREHFLSPILKAADAANFHAFTYHFGGYDIRIGEEMAKDLLLIAFKQLGICKELMTQISHLLIETNGEYAEFLSTSISDVGLSTRTYHGLKGSGDCTTMLDVAKLGSYGVSRLRMLGSKSVEEIRKVFIKAGCVELFDTEKP